MAASPAAVRWRRADVHRAVWDKIWRKAEPGVSFPSSLSLCLWSQAARQGFPPSPRDLCMLTGNFHIGFRSAQGVILFDPNFFF